MSQDADTSTGRAVRPDTPRRRLGWAIVPAAIFAAVAALFALALTTGDPAKIPSALIGKPAPQFALPPLEGLVANGRAVPGFSRADLARGQVSVVNFWASWCLPCVEEHPLLIELSQRTGVTLYGINYKDQTAAARRFLGTYGNPFAAVGVDGSGRTAIEWGVYGMPETFVLDGEGRIVHKHVGPLTRETLTQRMLPAIEKARAVSPPR